MAADGKTPPNPPTGGGGAGTLCVYVISLFAYTIKMTCRPCLDTYIHTYKQTINQYKQIVIIHQSIETYSYTYTWLQMVRPPQPTHRGGAGTLCVHVVSLCADTKTMTCRPCLDTYIHTYKQTINQYKQIVIIHQSIETYSYTYTWVQMVRPPQPTHRGGAGTLCVHVVSLCADTKTMTCRPCLDTYIHTYKQTINQYKQIVIIHQSIETYSYTYTWLQMVRPPQPTHRGGGGNIMCTCSIFVCRHKNNDMSTLLGHAHTYIPTDRQTDTQAYIHKSIQTYSYTYTWLHMCDVSPLWGGGGGGEPSIYIYIYILAHHWQTRHVGLSHRQTACELGSAKRLSAVSKSGTFRSYAALKSSEDQLQVLRRLRTKRTTQGIKRLEAVKFSRHM